MALNVLLFKLNATADEIIPPLSLGYLAAAAPRHRVGVLDGQKEGLDGPALARLCRETGVQVLGLQVWTKDLGAARDILRLVKAELPGVVTVIGGVQPSVMPEETCRFMGPALDFAFHGEAEAGFAPWLDLLESGGSDWERIPGLAFRRGQEVVLTPEAPVKDLDAIPFPRWDLMPPSSYPQAPHGAFFKHFPVAPLITSRGCPYTCTFCSAPVLSGRRIRFRSLDNVFAEITWLHTRFGVRELHVEDDNFSINKAYVLEFCRRMEATGYGLSWAFPNGVRLDTLDEEMLSAMRRAGCYALNFGIESGSDETLRRIRKKTTVAAISDRLALVRKFGFIMGGFFIIGFPWETERHIQQTIDFACSSVLDMAGFSYFQPFPGTELARELEASGEYVIDLEHFDTSLHTISYVPRALTRERLQALRQQALRRFYFRPRVAASILMRANSLQHYKFIFKRGLRWLAS